MTHRFPSLRRRLPLHQRRFRFAERGDRLVRRFKLSIFGFTVLSLALLLVGTASGRYAASWSLGKLRRGLAALSGRANDRCWIDADWRRRRLFDVDQARAKLRTVYESYDPRLRKLVDAAGLDPDHALLRWGNFDKALLLPSTVFVPDETGRSYRFRPNTRSIWVRNLQSRGGVLAFFQVPDTPEIRMLAEGAGAVVVEGSAQTTNSWGLRGGEPDVSAEIRGIILGDSYMQGLYVGDEQTPSECLKRALADHDKSRVEVLNTGHLGYSPEQEYFTLLEYAGRFPPQFVVLSLFANDFGDLFEVLEGQADWEENRYWIGKIVSFCQARNIPCLVVPAPWVNHVEGQRSTAFYPGRIPAILPPEAVYFDPMEDFIDADSRERLRRLSRDEPANPSELFNGKLADGHFSALGCQVWAQAVGRRLVLILDMARVKTPSPPSD